MKQMLRDWAVLCGVVVSVCVVCGSIVYSSFKLAHSLSDRCSSTCLCLKSFVSHSTTKMNWRMLASTHTDRQLLWTRKWLCPANIASLCYEFINIFPKMCSHWHHFQHLKMIIEFYTLRQNFTVSNAFLSRLLLAARVVFNTTVTITSFIRWLVCVCWRIPRLVSNGMREKLLNEITITRFTFAHSFCVRNSVRTIFGMISGAWLRFFRSFHFTAGLSSTFFVCNLLLVFLFGFSFIWLAPPVVAFYLVLFSFVFFSI